MYVIATAGHVDHGKSTLVQAMTGIDPDRLIEEKERGLTIDLGFAWLTLPSGKETSIVDVPGHERFVSNMLAGVSGIDLALLVVAADESVMPQTREHLAILDLLSVRRGLVAITKRDLVDDAWLELVMADVEDALEGTTLDGSTMVPVSAATGDGLDDLVSAIDSQLQETDSRKDLGRPRLPIDRSFSMSGFGTVVTGTLIDGSVSVGQEVELVPSGHRSRIRGLQSHKHKLDSVPPGRRTAANLAGIAPSAVARGDVLTTPGWLRPTDAMDVHLRVIPDAPRAVRHNMFVTVHTGSSEAVGRLRLLDQDRLEPGADAWAQIKTEQPIAVVKGDCFVIRSNQTTLGGGNIVELHAKRHRRRHSPILERLELMLQGSDRDVLLKSIEASEPAEPEALSNRANMEPSAARAELRQMAAEGLVVALGNGSFAKGEAVYTASGWADLAGRAAAFLDAYHASHPLRPGAPREELRSRLKLGPQLFSQAIPRLAESGVLAERDSLVHRPGHTPKPSPAQVAAAQRYVELLASAPYSPPTDDLLEPELVSMLADEGKVVRVSETVVFTSKAYAEMTDRISTFAGERGQVTVADVRDMLDTSRKYAISLLDHLDQQGVTRRVGDARVLR